MEFKVLGELEVLRDGEPVDLGAFRQRSVLALLLTRPNAVVSSDELIEGVWGDDGTNDRQNSLWVYVSGLRKALEPDRPKGADSTILTTRSPGYVLQVEPDELDTLRFERLIAEGRGLRETDPGAASLVLGEALALWRGRPFEDFTYESFAQAEISRLDGLRLEAVEARIDADLARGLAPELVSELETLVRQHPLREGFTGQLMTALYRSGRQADALRAYGHLRARLGDELGIEPSGGIRRLEERIVTGDHDLERAGAPVASIEGRAGLAVRGYELREQLGERAPGMVYRAFQPAVGREVAIKVIPAELADDPDFIRRFEAQAQLIAGLEHPHVVPLYDYWREPGAAYLVMRLMRGGSLAHLLEQRALDPGQAIAMVDQLAGALQAAHNAGIVHCDVRPDNVLFDDDGNAYLSDFAIAGDDVVAGSSPATDVRDLGETVAQALTGLVVDVGQIRGALTPTVRQVVDRATAPEPDARYESVAALGLSLRGALGDAELDAVSLVQLENPFKGLRAFGPADSGDFFGREQLVDRLIAHLGAGGSSGRFLTVVGPSGSGKSSAVRAGLVPALRRGGLAGSENWFAVAMTPAPHPFEQLEDALLHVAIDPPPNMLEQLTNPAGGLHRVADRILPDDDSHLVLVIDQFEELFTQVDSDTADRFAAMLAASAAAEDGRVRVVATLRADFYDRPLRHRHLGELLRDGTEVVTPMTPEELERAITGPARPLGVTFDPSLVAALVRDVVDRAGALPLLQYTLTELFDGRQGARITEDAYRALGGVSGALVARAEGLLGQLRTEAQEATRQVFLRLVTLGEGSDDTRRRVLRTELEDLSIDPQVLRDVLDTFGRHRMLSFDRDPVTRSPTVEISHEALLTEWDRLSAWIDAARHDVRNQRRLAEAMRDWQAAGESTEYLLRGGRLEQLNGWATTTDLPLAQAEQAFLDASVAERNRVAEADVAREKRAADAERQARQRSRQLTLAGGVAVVVAALAAFGIWQWRWAEDQRAEAEDARAGAEAAQAEAETAQSLEQVARIDAEEARDANDSLVMAEQLRAASDVALPDEPELALLLAVEAVRATADLGFATEEAVDSLHWALQRLGVQYPVGRGAPTAVRSGPTGLTGVFLLPPAELVAAAEASTDRRLTAAECQAATGRACSPSIPLSADLPLRFGESDYSVVVPDVVPGVSTFGDGPLAGTRVSFAPVGTVAFRAGMERELERFTAVTGIQIDLVTNLDFDLTAKLSTAQVTSYPDVAGLFQPPATWVRERAIDLAGYLDEDTLRRDFGDHLIDLGLTAGPAGPKLHSLPANVNPKGLVFYPKPAFDAAGYEVPATWDELVNLTEQMVADGHEPWCFQWEAGFASGFAGSDLLEALVLRVGGVEIYDGWVAGDLAFDSPEIIEAARLGEELLFGDGFVRGGTGSISREGWGVAGLRLLEVNPVDGTQGPECFLLPSVAQIADLLGPTTDFGPGGLMGVDVDFFMLPPLEAGAPAPVTGGGLLVAQMVDRPEVRVFMNFMASPEWGQVWAGSQSHQGDTFVSANRRFDTQSYFSWVDPDTGQLHIRHPDDFAARIRMHNAQLDALDTGTWRYDASDAMPTTFGAWTEEFVPGPFWQGMLDWVDQVKPIEEILADIEAARPD